MGDPRVRAAQINNRYIGQVLGGVNGTGAVSIVQRLTIGHGALRLVVDIHIEAANFPIHFQELVTGDHTTLQRPQAILNAHVIQRNAPESPRQQLFVRRPHF